MNPHTKKKKTSILSLRISLFLHVSLSLYNDILHKSKHCQHRHHRHETKVFHVDIFHQFLLNYHMNNKMLFLMYPKPNMKSNSLNFNYINNKPKMVLILFLYQLEYILLMFYHVMKNVHQQLIVEREP